ncbi:MAG: DNA-binding protein WhiA [Clostridia bacterium]|nr:DNA-binding protein WhiA [Clostridiales bacterium]MBQ7917610.1 DNA-binding protein WhiA [Clostridia bacterium]
MAITSDVKLEIIKKNLYKKEMKSLLQGFFVSAGSLILSSGHISFVVSSDLEEVINFVHKNLTAIYPDYDFNLAKVVRSFKNKEKFEISSMEYGEKVLKDLGIVFEDKEGMTQISDVCDKAYLKNETTMKAFLTGLFLGTGSLSVPNAAAKKQYGYHFEINVETRNQVDLIAEIFSNFDIFPKVVERGEELIVYLKDSETICDVLGLFGANKIVLDVMNTKVDRDMNNMMNRQVNCISANLDKTINASLKQIKAIEVIRDTIGIESLPDTLCEAALLRLSNPEASLSDLLNLMETKISKGALAQRFDKIIKLSEELGDYNG